MLLGGDRRFFITDSRREVSAIQYKHYHVLFHSAIVASFNRTFHFPPHENILTIALKNIQCLYTTRAILFHFFPSTVSAAFLQKNQRRNYIN